ncbi:MAG: hypothetical protein K2J80_01805 [Oscillospiraceae bacterium]|nr:hypothetical protein [Oscillospiraceae bacterium]
MSSVNITKKMITIHMIVILGVCIVFGAVNMAGEGGLFIGIGIIVCGAAVAAAVSILKNSVSLLTQGMILSVFQLLLIIVASSLRHELHGMFPLMLASTTIAGIYFDRRNIIIQIVMINIASIAGLFFRDFFYSGTSIDTLLKGVLGMDVGAVMVIYLIKCCTQQIKAADEARHEASELLERVKAQSDNEKRAAAEQTEIVEQIAEISLTVNDSSDRMLEIADSLSASAEEQTSTIAEVTDALGALVEQTEKSLADSEFASQLAKESAELLDDGNTEAAKMAAAMSRIEQSSEEISSIVKTIEDIAFQTNILALNASIEAARAGAAGKGFAVVADEVRNLAAKSSDAVSNTSELIAASSKAVDEGKLITDNVIQKMQNVMGKSEQSAERAKLISQLTREQAQSLLTVKSRMDEISQSVAQSTEVSARSTRIAEQVAGGAKKMNDITARFRASDNTQA